MAQLEISRSLDLDRIVLASRFISCARKSNFLPMLPPAVSVFFVVSMWLRSLTSSSSTHTLSAKIVTSVRSLPSSTVVSPNSSFTRSSSLWRYSAMIWGERSVMKSTSFSMPSSFAIRSSRRCSPSVIRVCTNISQAPLKALCSSFHSSSSSISCSSITNTSGYFDRVDTLISQSRSKSLAICFRYPRYSAASSLL